MSGRRTEYIYWDSNVFISYFEQTPDRVNDILAILREVERRDDLFIATSSLSIVEVAYVAQERSTEKLDDEWERVVDKFWNNQRIIRIIQINELIAQRARNIVRTGMERHWKNPNGWRKIKPPDALHLATAAWVGAAVVHTYDIANLKRYEEILKCGCKIEEPNPLQPLLLT